MLLIYQQMSTHLSQKIPLKYTCDICEYLTSNKKDYTKHLLTDKHKKHEMSTEINNKSPEIPTRSVCECGKIYKERSGLWRHKKKCTQKYLSEPDEEYAYKQVNEPTAKVNEPTAKVNEPTANDLIMLLIKENSDLKNMMMKVIETGTHNTTNNTNSHNKAFNLNFFLNETCKDAMNIMDFVESIKLQLSDLEKVGELGYVEGISNIIVKNLNDLDVTQRPVHCTDKKRETMYIKDEDKWEKDEENSKIKKVIKKVASKNQRLITKFKETHPDCIKYHSKYSDQYNKIIVESMGGSGDNDTEKEEKIIRNISKNVVVDK
jgi:hypothetical protein